MKTGFKTKLIALLLTFAMLAELSPVGAVDLTEEPAPQPSEETVAEQEPLEELPAEAEESVADEEETAEPATVVGEITELREETVKHFRMSDGSNIVVDYGAPVHYSTDAGKSWEDINNTLSLAVDDNYGDSAIQKYVTENGNQVTAFAEDLQSGFLFSTGNEGQKISFSLMTQENAQPNPFEFDAFLLDSASDCGVEGETENADALALSYEKYNASAVAEVAYPQKPSSQEMLNETAKDESGDVHSDTSLESQVKLKKLESEILYKNVFEDVDLQYTLSGFNVKESIIINHPRESYLFSFILNLEGLIPTLLEDGSIDLSDANGEKKYWIPAPFMSDSNNETSEKVFYTLSQNESDAWTLNVEADSDWINADERAFPVTIDPSIYYYGNSSNNRIYSSYVNSGNTPATSYTKHYVIRCGDIASSADYGNGHSIGLIYVNSLPDIPDGCVITDAQLGLFQTGYGYNTVGYYNYARLYTSTFNSGNTPSNVESYINGLSWNTFRSDISYGNGDSIENRTAIDYSKCQYNTFGLHYFNVTSTVRDWYANSTAISRLLVLDTEYNTYLSTVATFSGYYNGNIDHRPQLIITYRDMTGVEDIYDYHTQSIGRAGSGSVNNFTLGLTLDVPILSAPSDALPFGFSLYYNSPINYTTFSSSNLKTKNYSSSSTGYGWKTSVQQSVVPITLDGENGSQAKHLVYTDGDGTEHYFKLKSGYTKEYEDEDGLKLKITASETGTNPQYYTMEDTEKNKWRFDYGYLTSYTDNHGNAIYYAYNEIEYADNTTAWRPSSSSGAYRVTTVWRKNSGTTSAEKLMTLSYKENDVDKNRLVSVTDAASRTTYFSYSYGGDLIQITFPDYASTTAPNRTASYSYTLQTVNGKTYHCLTKARDNESQYEIRYTYQSPTYTRVREITEYAGAVGQEIAGATMRGYKASAVYTRFRYGGSDNTLSTPDDLVSRFRFDNWGHTINSVTLNAQESDVLGISAANYTKNEGTSKKNNRMTEAASAGFQSVNLLQNSGFEYSTSLYGWSGSGNGTAATVSASTVFSSESLSPRTGARMLQMYLSSSSQVKETCYQTVYLEADTTYVFSAYVNTAGADSIGTGGAYLSFRSGNGADISGASSRTIRYKTNKDIESGWERLEIVYTTPHNVSNPYQVAVNMTHMSQVIYVDDLQLEVCPNTGGLENEATASTVNLLQLGGFELPGVTGTQSQNAVTTWWTLGSHTSLTTNSAEVRSGTALKLDNSPDMQCRASQTVTVNAPSASTFLVSAWGKTPICSCCAASDVLYNNSNYVRFFGLIISLKYSDTTTPEYHYVAFNGDISDWQYATGIVVPKRENKTVSSITVTVAGDMLPNDSFVDDVTLVKEPVQSYSYDDDGKVTLAANSEGKTSTEYDSSERLKKYTALNGTQYNLTYQDTDRDPKTITSDGLRTTYSYNDAGEVNQTKIQPTNGTLYQESSAEYDRERNYNYKTSSTDVNGIAVYNSYDYRGLVETTTPLSSTPTERTITYKYDGKNDRPTSTYQSGVANLSYKYNNDGALEYLARKTFKGTGNSRTTTWQTYGIDYDNWGQKTQVRVSRLDGATWSAPTSSLVLASYSYNPSGTTNSLNYSNGAQVDYTYDLFDRVIKEEYTDGDETVRTNSYVYNTNGGLAKQYSSTGESYSFEYDSLGRLIRSREENENGIVQRTEHLYDTANRLTNQAWTIGSESFTESYTYRSGDGAINSMTTATGDILNYNYDALKRQSTVYAKDGNNQTIFYSVRNYKTTGNKSSNQISAFAYRKSSGDIINYNTYEYDALGNISQINQVTSSGTKRLVSYSYDNQNQLTEETFYRNDAGNGIDITYQYSYDTAGNLLSKSTSGITLNSYSYNNPYWADLLTAYNNHPIYYKGQETNHNAAPISGNPINWYNGSSYTNLTWTQGRRLSSLDKGNTHISYTYDMDGIRKSKTVGDTTYTYITQNGAVVHESVLGSDTNYQLDFIYDNSGKPFALIYTNASGTKTTFYYVLNLQGDVVSLINSYGTVYASYTYDAWGNVLTAQSYNNNYPYLHSVNPLRYRGYYYDTETGWYYLQSRYYDPVIKRFLNADCYASTGQGLLGYNMYSYCGNNPVIRADHDGNSYEATIGWTSTMWGLAVADGPLPIGDIIYFLGTVAIAIGDTINTIGVDNIVFYASNVPNQISDLVDRMSSNSGGSPSPRGPDFRKFTRSNFRYNLQQLTNEAGANMQAHHVLPQKLESFFNNAGINIHDPIYGSWVDSVEHSQWSYAYNQAWQHFFANYQNPSQGQILAYAKELADFFGFETLF